MNVYLLINNELMEFAGYRRTDRWTERPSWLWTSVLSIYHQSNGRNVIFRPIQSDRADSTEGHNTPNTRRRRGRREKKKVTITKQQTTHPTRTNKQRKKIVQYSIQPAGFKGPVCEINCRLSVFWKHTFRHFTHHYFIHSFTISTSVIKTVYNIQYMYIYIYSIFDSILHSIFLLHS